MTLPPDAEIEGKGPPIAARLLLVAALLSGFGLVWPLLQAGPLVLDEHVAYWIVGPDNPGSLLERSLNVAATPPMSFWMQRMVLDMFGESELAFRAPSAICYLLAIGVTFLLGKELLGSYAGALAALVFAWHPGVVDEIRVARPYGATVLFAALAFWLSVRWMKQPNSSWLGIGWVAANGALMWTHYVNFPAVILQLLVLVGVPVLMPRQAAPALWRLLVATIVLVGISAPLWGPMLRIWEWSPFLNFIKTESSLMQVLGSLWWAGLPAGWFVAVLCSAGASGTGGAGISGGLRWLVVWGLLPLVGVALLSRGDFTSLANPRYLIVYSVPAACLLSAILSRSATRIGAGIGGVVAIGVAWWAVQVVPWELQRAQPQRATEWVTIAETLEELGEIGEPLFVQSGLIEGTLVPGLYRDPLFMDYVACRAGRFYVKTPHPRYGLPFFWENDAGLGSFFGELLDERCMTATPIVWVVAATDTDLNQQSVAGMDTLLRRRGYAPDLNREFEFAVLVRYRCGRLTELHN